MRALALGELEQAARCAEASDALALASPERRAEFASAAALAAAEQAKTAFLDALQAGRLRARVMQDGREMEIAPAWWLAISFNAARLCRPPIYFAAAEFAKFIGATNVRSRRPQPAHVANHAALVAFLVSACPPAPEPVPSEKDDRAAASARFGRAVSWGEIRDARRDAYGEGRIRRGKPRRSNSEA